MNAMKTERPVQFLFDYGSPNAYLCHKVIPDIAARSGAQFAYVPILLGGLFKLSNNRSAKAREPEIKARLIDNTQSAFDRGLLDHPRFLWAIRCFSGRTGCWRWRRRWDGVEGLCDWWPCGE